MRKKKKRMKQYDPDSTLYGLNTDKRDIEIIVSFTTYTARLMSAAYVADVMLRQTLKPDRIILVLSDDEFESKDVLPKEYQNLEKRGLSIVFTENLKPHKKYRYAMQNHPDSLIVTVDDDILYKEDLIETLYTSYKKYPNAVSAIRMHRMKFSNNKLQPYNNWDFEALTGEPVFNFIATNGAGSIFPPRCFEKKRDLLFNSSIIKKTCLEADDIWLKIIELLCDIPVVSATQNTENLVLIPRSQRTSLHSSNVERNLNDKVLHSIMNHLGISEEKLYQMTQGVEATKNGY